MGTAQLTLRYDGMGGLLTSQLNWLTADPRVEEYRRDALGNLLWEGTVGEVTRRPPATFQYGSLNRLQRRDALPPSGPSTCTWAYPDSVRQSYDGMGNVATKRRWTYVGQGSDASCTTVQTGLELEFHWYTADNKLAVVQRQAGNPQFTVRTGTFEEYRYDPFGRRIGVIERRDSLANQLNMESAQTWTIWDGDRLLYEQRGRVAGESAGNFFRYGTIGYIHGRELDAPLALTDGRIPLPDWRGQYQGSLWADGTPADCATSQGGKCTNLDWPAKTVAMTLRGWHGAGEEGIAYVWKGSIVSANRDGTGLHYRRNRYYDPVTGRFTQVDPIGLAGGVNVYGFAEGDPVNFGDPFGLQNCKDDPEGAACRFIRGVRDDVREGAVFVGAHAAGLAAAGVVGRVLGALRARFLGSLRRVPGTAPAEQVAAGGVVTLEEGQALLAVVKDGRIVAQTADVALSHARFVEQTLGTLPEGARVVTIGKFQGEIYAQNSRTFHGNQLPAPEHVLDAIKRIFK